MELTPRTVMDACWKGYVQKGTKKKGNRMVPNCVPAGKAKGGEKAKAKAAMDVETKVGSSQRSVWADGFEPKKTKALS